MKSMKYDYINKDNNVPSILNFIDSYLSKLPEFNSIFGLCLYSFIIYMLMLGIRIFCRKPNDEEEGVNNENKELENIKKRREELLKNPKFMKKIEDNRKKKSKDAMELLNKINS